MDHQLNFDWNSGVVLLIYAAVVNTTIQRIAPM